MAVIMELVEHLVEHPDMPRPTVKVCFTCDEEIGHGVDHVDLAKLGRRFATRSTAAAAAN